MSKTPTWLTEEVRAHLDLVIYEFHVRAFGEQLARINFLPLDERKAAVAAMVDHARSKGVRHDKPAWGTTP